MQPAKGGMKSEPAAVARRHHQQRAYKAEAAYRLWRNAMQAKEL